MLLPLLLLLLAALVASPARSLSFSPGSPAFGFHIDWGATSPASVGTILGRPPACFAEFYSFGASSLDPATVEQHATLVKAAGASCLFLSLEPWFGLDSKGIAGTDIAAIADACNRANALGVDIIVRFAHEMNAPWYPWGLPAGEGNYIAAYRRVVSGLRAQLKNRTMTYTLWAPQMWSCEGRGPVEDPYGRWYPGDDYVDIVGFSLFHFPTLPSPSNPLSRLFSQNPAPAGMLSNILRGRPGGGAYCDFRNVFGDKKAFSKPIIVAETGVGWSPAQKGETSDQEQALELSIKRTWWRQLLFANEGANPLNISMVMWFEFNKTEQGFSGMEYRDFRILTGSNATRDAFLDDYKAKTQ